ncbi:hypothetical protein CspeluHIS016_0802390 [Cutaneotrichosporon spelunceum]|uniref:Uncharacterized protein n=1 Tax=Cutaneotrichosporon spelunceum TaxID=1672016 RepID=A0AAD3YEZ2_9TREE|nr:hypothetical protein CspeluHIS016_0802390 [Cutaneotrichosporon spelunceum]
MQFRERRESTRCRRPGRAGSIDSYIGTYSIRGPPPLCHSADPAAPTNFQQPAVNPLCRAEGHVTGSSVGIVLWLVKKRCRRCGELA